MKNTDLQKFKSKLEVSFLEVERYLKSSAESAAAVSPDKSLGRLSRLEAMQDQQLVLEMRRRKKRQLAEIKYALMKIETNQLEYGAFCSLGICEDDFELGEVVVRQRGNLFHVRCFYSDEDIPDIKIGINKTFDNTKHLK